jgi:hypothetical protein
MKGEKTMKPLKYKISPHIYAGGYFIRKEDGTGLIACPPNPPRGGQRWRNPLLTEGRVD